MMRGRWQSAAIAFIGLPFISPAAVALVSLRRGSKDGAFVLFWAVLPLLLVLSFAETNLLWSLMALLGTGLLFGLALLLRHRNSWPVVLTVNTALGLLVSVVMEHGFGELLQQTLVEIQANPVWQQLPEKPLLDARLVADVAAFMLTANVLLALLLARFWQSRLYHPGGFQIEFHQLRLPPQLAILLLLAVLFNANQAASLLLSMPLLISGIALLHGVAKLRGASRGWLLAMYVGLLTVQMLALVLMVLAVFDTWLDFRGRIARSA